MMRLIPLVVLCALVGCPRGKQAGQRLKMSKEVEIFDRSRPADRVPGVAPGTVKGWIVKTLGASGAVQLVDRPGPDVYGLRVELGVATRGKEHVALVAARGDVPGGVDRVILQASVVHTLSRADAASLRKVVETVTRDIAFQAGLAVGAPEKAVRVLETEKDPQRLAAAVEIAAVRRLKAAVPALIKLLRHKDPAVADRTIGALVAIGDRRAVKPLTRLSRFSDTEKMAKIIDGIGSLGGKEAQDWLELVASGHEDADIRNLAREALERMGRSSKK